MLTKRDQRWIKNEEVDLEPVAEGLERKILAYDKDIMTVENHFQPGAIGAMHSHPHTQITYVVSGKFCFTIDGEMKIVTAGDAMLKTNSVPHGCVCLEEGILLDIFTPMREDFVAAREAEEAAKADKSVEPAEEAPEEAKTEEPAPAPQEAAPEKKEWKVAIAGIGGAGINMVNEALAEQIPVAVSIAIDTDMDDLERSVATHRMLIKDGIEDTLEQVGALIQDMDAVLIATGMGGMTGTHAAPLIADLAKELGVLNVAFVAKPFMFEGSPRLNAAMKGINQMGRYADAMVVINNNRVMELADRNMPIPEAMKLADDSFVTVSKFVSYLAADEETESFGLDDILEIIDIFVIGDEVNRELTEVYC